MKGDGSSHNPWKGSKTMFQAKPSGMPFITRQNSLYLGVVFLSPQLITDCSGTCHTSYIHSEREARVSLTEVQWYNFWSKEIPLI